ncbi:MAG: bifunctional DNA-formamidopyrimidine glycosylase/DNA-(apurinic or apyrimidinic site) lyase [Acidimicrobiia bacterium]|nr:bifunctional DNA-formamidopyrimidine glycosylase/DNA-(apurinic or apyrimidinic site) lyase [Acidimicrobiia bacterium]MDH5236368.1 bifunctional DNA-formamidopyrimidine glycosylase/DNA-(apurinic or apyrimidinic site) lyase [Acidimicrobiia bacterium]
MPELPEVETIRRVLVGWIADRQVVDAGSHPSEKFSPALDLVGETLTDLRRRGKYLLFETDGNVEMVAHLGMTGSFLRDPDPALPHLRAWWRLDDDTVLGFRDIRRFGRLRVVPAGDHRSIATLHHMGPEPFGEDFTPNQLWAELHRSSRPVKTQLLSQRPVAGLGNIYADEALWEARISPLRRRLGRDRARSLHHAVRAVLAQGIANGGTTLRDYRTASGDLGSNQHQLHCYGRGGEPCARCGTALSARLLDARRTTWCSRCQR